MANYRVLVSDPISEKGVDALRNAPGISVDVNTGLKPDELLKIIGDYHGWSSVPKRRSRPKFSPPRKTSRSSAAPAWAWTTSTAPPPPTTAWS
jgi:hypothetical protein